MIFLPDTNVLLALLWKNHALHAKAEAWFASLGIEQWATTPVTKCGFVRLSCNPKVVSCAISAVEAIALLAQATDVPNHVFWENALQVCRSPFFPADAIRGYLQVPDAYLLGECLEQNGRLVTFDRGIPQLARTPAQKGAIVLLS